MEYEVMKEKHLPQLSEMYVEAFNAPPWNDEWTLESAYERLLQMMKCEGFYGLVAIDNNHSICGMIMGNHEIYFTGIHFHIKEFCVRTKLRRAGIGSALLKEFENHLAQKGIESIYLFTSKTDETEAYYQKMDYNSNQGMIMMGKNLLHLHSNKT